MIDRSGRVVAPTTPVRFRKMPSPPLLFDRATATPAPATRPSSVIDEPGVTAIVLRSTWMPSKLLLRAVTLLRLIEPTVPLATKLASKSTNTPSPAVLRVVVTFDRLTVPSRRGLNAPPPLP